MNEQISRLIKQATNPDYDSDDGPMNELNLEKFAELIVRECVTKISNERKHYNPTEWDQGADWGHKNSIDALKKHFGVEE